MKNELMEKNGRDICKVLEKSANFEMVKEYLSFRLLNAGKNQELLRKAAHIRFLDLAIVPDIAVEADNGQYRAYIPSKVLKDWGMTVNEIWMAARENACKTNPVHILDMERVQLRPFGIRLWTGNFSMELEQIADINEGSPSYILTNRNGMYGAGCILYEGILESISERFQKDILIIPSSVHETLLIPDDGWEIQELEKIVSEVNTKVVADREILSDRVYRYSRKKLEIVFAGGDGDVPQELNWE